MLKKLNLTMILALLGACASAPPEPEPEPAPPPVEIAEAPEPGPPPDQPPPPDMPQKPAQTDAGMFRISIAALDSAAIAAPWVSKAEAAGYRTEVLAVEIDGRTWHRVLLPGYASLDDANRASVVDLVQEAREKGAAILAILHDTAARNAVATRIFELAAPRAEAA